MQEPGSLRGDVSEDALIGFDARETGDAVDRWDDGRRRRAFLLREDVARPLAAGGTLTWPSVFDTGQGSGNAGGGAPAGGLCRNQDARVDRAQLRSVGQPRANAPL